MTAAYQLTATDLVIRTGDGARIPNDARNTDRATYSAWLAAGGVPDPYVAPAPPAQVLSQNLLAQFTVADYAQIKVATAASDSFGLLWASLLGQQDPMEVTNARFMRGWNALVQVLGQARMNVIAGPAPGLNLPSLIV